jgi:TRAP-type transport system small permease protein
MSDSLKKIDRAVLALLKGITIASFAFLTLLISANVFVRFVPIVSLHWFDEIIELLYAYLVFYGAAALWISRDHFGVGDWIEKRIRNERARAYYRMIIELLVAVFAVIFFYYSLKLTILARDVTNVFGIPKRVLYSCLPVSGAIMVIYSVRRVAAELIGAIEPPQGEPAPRRRAKRLRLFNKPPAKDKGASYGYPACHAPGTDEAAGHGTDEAALPDRSAF